MQGTNLRTLFRTVETLADLGSELTADRDFRQTAHTMLTAVMEAAGASEGVLFSFGERPSLLTSVDATGFALLPEPSLIPLLPRHIHSLTAARGPVVLNASSYDAFLSANGNVAPELFKCICPLKVRAKLVGVIALGRRPADAVYEEDALEALRAAIEARHLPHQLGGGLGVEIHVTCVCAGLGRVDIWAGTPNDEQANRGEHEEAFHDGKCKQGREQIT